MENLTKHFIVLDNKNNHEYDVFVEDKKNKRVFSIYTSDNETWNASHRKEHLLTMTNNGNGIKFDRKIKKIGYDELEYLKILISVEDKLTKEELKCKYTIINSRDLIKI